MTSPDMASAAPTLEQTLLGLAQRFDLKGLTLTAQRGHDGEFFFCASATAVDADGKFLHGSGFSTDATSLSECIKEALGDLILKRAPVVELVELPAIEVAS